MATPLDLTIDSTPLIASDETASRILNCATKVFLRAGYDAASVDEIAMAAKASKRTIYARYADKSTLFRAVIDSRIAHWSASVGKYVVHDGDLGKSLEELANHLNHCWLEPGSIEVQRLVITESHRWPELGTLFTESASRPAIRLIKTVLTRYRGELRRIDLQIAAEIFFGLAVESHLFNAHFASRATAPQILKRTKISVGVFLRGIHVASVRT